MEEAAQMLEIETLISMVLQPPESVDECRLKRVVLIGDHHQLPPVVKHNAFRKYANFDQSMFARFICLGIPSIVLNEQGRARAEIATLYSWKYQNATNLGNLETVLRVSPYTEANAGFLHTFQLIDVPAFEGCGETSPTPFSPQNLGEAEYVVAVYQFMRLLGYPAERISILATYKGQVRLLRALIARRCASALFGPPARVCTVDRCQGRQSDYILLSLVRTEAVGHIRDVRRLVVALSRARLGLYVFCRSELFLGCAELAPAFQRLLQRPPKLQLVVGEEYPCHRRSDENPDPANIYTVQDVTAMGVLVYQIVQQAAITASITAKTGSENSKDFQNS